MAERRRVAVAAEAMMFAAAPRVLESCQVHQAVARTRPATPTRELEELDRSSRGERPRRNKRMQQCHNTGSIRASRTPVRLQSTQGW